MSHTVHEWVGSGCKKMLVGFDCDVQPKPVTVRRVVEWVIVSALFIGLFAASLFSYWP